MLLLRKKNNIKLITLSGSKPDLIRFRVDPWESEVADDC